MKKLLKFLFITILILGVIQFIFNQNCHSKSLSEQVGEVLRNRIEAAGTPPNLKVGDEFIHASIMLPIFYERRIYEPAWSNNKGLLSVADELVKAIQQADREGLRSIDYHLSKIEALINDVRNNQNKHIKLNPRVLVDLDLLLTDAFLIYGSHLLAGRINPLTIDAEWFANRREADLAQVLQNALEQNQLNVYLHDTPSLELFKKIVRDFSSGCIRIEKPIDLAEYVLRGGPKWTRKDILAALAKGVEQTIRLPEPIPVHLLYWTAWATENGTIHFRNDIYDRDKPLLEALREEPPGL